MQTHGHKSEMNNLFLHDNFKKQKNELMQSWEIGYLKIFALNVQTE